MRRHLWGLIVGVLLPAAPAAADGAFFIGMDGVITQVDAFGAGVAPVAVGQVLIGSIDLRMDAPDSEPDTRLGLYDGGVEALHIILGSKDNRFRVPASSEAVANLITVDDGFTTAGEDAIAAAYVGPSGSLGLQELQLDGVDPTGSAWVGDAFYPAPFWCGGFGPQCTPPPFDDASLTLVVFTGPADGYTVQATVDVFGLVPEPSPALLLLVAALTGVAALRRAPALQASRPAACMRGRTATEGNQS